MHKTYKLKKFLTLLVLLALPLKLQAGVFTDLGKVGNNFVAERFNAYKSKHPSGQCTRQSPSLPYAIVTGFGRFQGVQYNVSGAVVETLGSTKITPQKIKTLSPFVLESKPALGLLSEEDFGGRANTRVLEINSKKVEICFLVLDVVWDLAASIILFESSFVNPNAILMMGRGFGSEVRFEAFAQNNSTGGAGYAFDGTLLETENTPVTQVILSDYPYNDPISFTWSPKAQAKAAKKILKKSSLVSEYETAAGFEDNFICNNVSYVVGSAIQNRPVVLAGGSIVMEENLIGPSTKFGFLHLPSIDSDEPTEPSGTTVELLTRVVSNTIWSLL